MSVLVVGDSPVGPIIVTDAFVLHDEPSNIRSFRDTSLQFKITLLTKFSGCCSLVGDQIIEYAICAIDNWATFKNVDVNFISENTIRDAVLPAAEKLIQIFKAKGVKQPETDGADLYILSPQGAWEIQISRKNEKYSLDSFKQMSKNSTLINYGGHKESVFLRGNEENIFEKAIAVVENHHLIQKQNGKYALPYDLESRFCGVFYPFSSNGARRLIHPFSNFNEYLLFASGNQRPWESIGGSPEIWEPSL